MTSARSNESISKVLALSRYWRSDIGNYFIKHVSRFVEELPNLLIEEAKLLSTTQQQDYLDISLMLRREKNQIHSGISTAITVLIEEFNHQLTKVSQNNETTTSLSLIDAEDIELSVVAEGLAARVASPINDVLNDAFLRIKQLAPSVRDVTQLPCHPKSLIQAMLDGFTTLSLSSSQKIILAKLFAPTLEIERLGDIITRTLNSADIPDYDQTIKNLDHGTSQTSARNRSNTQADLASLANNLSKMNLTAQKGGGQSLDKDAKSEHGLKRVGDDAKNGYSSSAHNFAHRDRTEDANKLLSQLGQLKELRQQLGRMPVAPEPKNPMVAEQQLETNELTSLLDELQKLQPTASVKKDTTVQSIGEIRNQIRSQLRSDNEVVQSIQEKDTDVINLMSLMFDYILDNPNLPTAMKALLARLQIPMLRVALKSPEFFSQSNHPARRLLDKLAKAGIGWDKANQKDDYYDKLESIVFRILKEFRGDVGIFDKLNAELEDYLAKQHQLTERTEIRTRTKETKKAQTVTAQSFVQQQLNSRLVGKQLPLAVVKILQNGWWHVLYHVYIRHGEQSSQYKTAIKVVDALIWSMITPEGNQAEWLKQVAHIRHKLTNNLDKGLTQVNYDALEKKQLIAEIDSIYDKLLKKEAVEHIGVKLAAPKSNKVSDFKVSMTPDDLHSKPQVELPNNVDEDEQVDSLGKKSSSKKEVTPAMLDSVTSIATGTWIEFDADTEDPKRRKLVAVIRALNKMIFTNRRGIKVAEIKLASLSRMLESGAARIIDDESVVDSAIGSVIDTVGGVGA